MAMLLVLFAGTMAQAAAAPGGVDVSYTLPTDGPLPQTYRVTLAIVDPKRPAWIISRICLWPDRDRHRRKSGEVYGELGWVGREFYADTAR